MIKALSLDKVLVEKSTYNRWYLKKRLVAEGLLVYECEKCHNKGSWLGESLSLQLEHKNGINDDNRINNLCFLCPNCHSQTDTFSGRNCKWIKKEHGCEKCNKPTLTKFCSIKCSNSISTRKRHLKVINRPSLNSLLEDLKTESFLFTGKKYGVSDNCIRKWLKGYGLSKMDIKALV
jgi:hypothetical protein